MPLFENKVLLITGGTGSFGHAVLDRFLTTDIRDIEQWQGGDIVIFKNHIGIVSDKRNSRGTPFVLHNSNPVQRYYEEDILARRDDLVAHYRIS